MGVSQTCADVIFWSVWLSWLNMVVSGIFSYQSSSQNEENLTICFVNFMLCNFINHGSFLIKYIYDHPVSYLRCYNIPRIILMRFTQVTCLIMFPISLVRYKPYKRSITFRKSKSFNCWSTYLLIV